MKANMADNEVENSLITIATLPNVTNQLNSDTVIVADPCDERVITDEDAEDILQQAIQDAQEFGEEAVTLSYVTEGDGEGDSSAIVTHEINNVIHEANLTTSVAVDENAAYDVSYVVADNTDLIQTDVLTLHENVADNDIESVMIIPESQSQQNEVVTFQQQQANENTVNMQTSDFVSTVQQGGLNVTLVPANQNSVAPIGSSQNPIRIVQQGNQYTPVQQLTAEQLQQIMHVVQEQQLTKSADSNDGSSILYNPQTNTRIVYRVIYPSELHNSSGTASQSTTITIGSQTGIDTSQTQRRVYKKRSREDEEQDKVDGPEMSKEEKEERKKHRPRTRSGRVSKPPKHMVKDYKHIHVLDWDEDYDDSDGGYSDFKISDEDKEKGEGRTRNNSDNLDTDGTPDYIDGGSGVERVKNFKCEGCDKAYIGQGGLRRHYQLNPSHNNPSEESEAEKAVPATDSPSIIINNNNNPTNGSIGSISEDSNTQDSIPSQSTHGPSTLPANKRPRGRPGRPCLTSSQLSLGIPGKRRAKLQELIRQCTDDELMEIVLPRLANVITLWEFLMMKVEKGGKALPKIGDIIHEFETLQKQVSKTCRECLIPCVDNKQTMEQPTQSPILQIDDSVMATCLGVKVGQYQVKTLPQQEKSFHYKLLTAEPLGIPAKKQNNRRTIEIVTPAELIHSKKPKMTTLLTNSVVSMAAKASNNSTVSVPPVTTTKAVAPPPVSFLSTSTSLTSITSAMSATPMQIIVNNHNSLLSEPIQIPITSQVPSTATNGASCTGNTQTVILTNNALPHTTFETINGGSVLNLNGNNSILVNPTNGTSLLNGNSSIVNPQLKLAAQSSNNAQVSAVPNYVTTLTLNNQPVLGSQSVDVKPEIINTKLTEVHENVGFVSIDPGDMVKLHIQNGVQEGTNIAPDGTVQVEVIDSMAHELDTEQSLSADQIAGEIIQPDQIVTSASNIFQTEDGILIIQNPDGTTFQLQGADGIPLETVQALLAMESEGHFLEQEQIQTEMQ